MIEVKNLIKEFSSDNGTVRAIDDVSFKVNKGEIYGIIGLSGAGKSTLVRCINRLEEPSGGDIQINGKSIIGINDNELLEERREIGMIFQSFNLFMQKTVYENIAYPMEITKKPKEEIHNRVLELLDFIDLRDKERSYPSELSGGQKQRVAIARAIALNPKILLSDEGTSALDPANTQSVLQLLRKVVKEYQMTIIMITHQMEVAKDICDRIAVMEKGKIVEENTTDELFKSPKARMTRSFIQNVAEEDLEEGIIAADFKGDVYRLSYGENNAHKPLLSKCIRTFDVDLNIIAGNIHHIPSKKIGYLIIEMLGEAEEKEKALNFLKENGVTVEVL